MQYSVKVGTDQSVENIYSVVAVVLGIYLYSYDAVYLISFRRAPDVKIKLKSPFFWRR